MKIFKNILIVCLIISFTGLFFSVKAQVNQGAMTFPRSDFNLISGNAYDMLNLIPQVEVSSDGTISISGNGEALVMLDNKPAASGGEYRSILEQLTVDMISEIEIITGSSARYDAEASGGIVNINLIGDGLEGVSGTLEVKAQTGEKAGVNGGVMIKKGKWGARINANANQYKTQTSNHLYMENYYGNDTIFTDQMIWNTPLVHRLSSDFSLDYNFNDFHSIELIGALGGRSINVETEIESVSNEEDNTYSYTNIREDEGANSRMTLNYSGILSGDDEIRKQLDASAGYYFSKTANFKNMQLVFDDLTNTDFLNANLQVDYEQDLQNHSSLETGFRSYLRNSDMNYNRDSIGADGTITLILEDNFQFKENVHAGYFQWSGQKELFDLSFGMRSEISFVNANQKLLQKGFNNQYLHFFPSAHLAYNVAANHKISFNYNRTIRRPRMHEMNPFVNDMNPSSIQYGNPGLKPSLTHNIELKYNGNYQPDEENEQVAKNHSWSVSTSFRERKDHIYRATLASDKHEGVVETSFYNLKRRYDYNLELMYSINLFAWWKLDIVPSYRYLFQDGTNIDKEIKNKSRFYQVRLNSNIDLWNNAQFIINSFYRSAYDSPQGSQEAFGRTNFSFRQLLFDNKVTLTLGAKDPFGQSKVYSHVQQSDFIQDREFEFERSIYEVSLRFNIGKLQILEKSPEKINLLDD